MIKDFLTNPRIMKFAWNFYQEGKQLALKDVLSILKQGCGIAFVLEEQDFNCGDDFEYKDKIKVALCPVCLDKIEQISKEMKK